MPHLRAPFSRLTAPTIVPVGTLILVALLAVIPPAAADDPSPATGFRALLARHQREALHSMPDYVAKNPEADDSEPAAAWMFETAVAQGLEADVVEPAE